MRNKKVDRPEKEYSITKMILLFIAGLVVGFILFKFVLRI